MRGDICYEVKYLIHCIVYRRLSFVGYRLIVVYIGMKYHKLAEQGARKNMSEIYNNLLLSSHKITSILEKTVYKQIEKSTSEIPSCSRYLARAIYKLHLNSWNTKYSQNLTCVCKNILSVKHILLESPIITVTSEKWM